MKVKPSKRQTGQSAFRQGYVYGAVTTLQPIMRSVHTASAGKIQCTVGTIRTAFLADRFPESSFQPGRQIKQQLTGDPNESPCAYLVKNLP